MNYGRTWWGEKWLDAVKGVTHENRISRGKSYANTGKVYDINFNGNIVNAKVKGNYSPYYSVNIMFKSFNKAEKELIAGVINNSPTILSALLNKKLPEKLYYELNKAGIELFPKSWRDMNADCDCPDYAPTCKHIAGLIYMITREIDENPFKVFELHNCDLFSMINHLEDTNTTKIREIESVDDFFKKDEFEKGEIEKINFSKIPDLEDTTFLMLKDNPLFFEKDFKSILNKLYKNSSRKAKKLLKTKYSIEDYDDETLNKLKQLNEFKIDIDNDFSIANITLDCNLYHILKDIYVNGNINDYNDNFKFIDLVFKFSLNLIEKNAIIPHLLKNNETYLIRWAPALYDKQIQKIFNTLCNMVPEDSITFNKNEISKDRAVLAISSILINNFIQKTILTRQLQKYESEKNFKIFLGSKEQLENKDAHLINQWLSNFTLKNRDYNLFLTVEEKKDENFTIDLKVQFEDETPQNVNDVIQDKSNYKITDKKLQIISDIYLINQYLPAIEDSIDLNKQIKFNIDEFYDFFLKVQPLLEIIGVNVILPKNLYTPKLTLSIKSSKSAQNQQTYLSVDDIAKYDWMVAIGDDTYPVDEFEKLIKESKGVVRLANGYVILDEKDIKSFVKKIEKLQTNLSQNDLMQAILSGEFNEVEVDIDDELKSIFSDINKKEIITPPESVKADLREYQKVGFSWLVQNINNGFGSILADDMGLGKTLQVLTAIDYFKEQIGFEKEKVLIVMPSSLLDNWYREIKKFTPDLKAIIYHGPQRKFPKREYDIVLTSYGILRSDEKKIKKHKWFLMIIDEAQNIKNPLAKQTKAVKSIKAKHKIALSGTPVENRLSEYWSIFDFTNKHYLSTAKQFTKNFIKPIEKERNTETLETFKKITSPFILRRLKTDKSIINDLPDKIVNDVYCNLTPKQAALYEETLNSLMKRIENEEAINRRGLVFKLINGLKQICNHPAQFKKSKNPKISESNKLELLINILDNIIASNEKVLIFTQYVQMGEIIQDAVEKHFNTEALFFNGSLTRKKKDEIVKEFQNNPQKKILIISLKAGGTGLNLTAAQNVIHYDLWWNPAVENQATDRAYRIGQKENVMVYRFITSGTFEEKINQMIKDKEQLAKMTVSSEEKFITEMSNDELKDILELRN